MKTLYLYLFAFIIISFTGCDINSPFHNNNEYYDTTPPAPPTGIEVLNGDNRVDLFWNFNHEQDVAGYNIYYSNSYSGKYTLIGTTKSNSFVDVDAQNGNTYYYAVTAYDFSSNESDLSHDVIYSTPRPEGYNQSIFDYRTFPLNAGYSFTTYKSVPYDSKQADFFYEYYDGISYLDVWDDSDIQDMGATLDILDIAYAPINGWSTSLKRAYAALFCLGSVFKLFFKLFTWLNKTVVKRHTISIEIICFIVNS